MVCTWHVLREAVLQSGISPVWHTCGVMGEIMPEESRCPLCGHDHLEAFHEDRKRFYVRCQRCALVVVPDAWLVSTEEEKALYDLHKNDPGDLGYRRFLSRLCDPLLNRLAPSSSGLDFGCGPGPTLSVMLEESGHSVALYDLYYHNDPAVLNNAYDFICATEVVEHLRYPMEVFHSLFSILNPGGTLAIMTKLVLNQSAFSSWHYTHDPTHIRFFSRETFTHLATHLVATVEFVEDDVIFFQKIR